MSANHDPYHLTPDQQAHLASLADQFGKPWSQVLDEALANYGLAGQFSSPQTAESFFDAAARLGLIGCVEGGPPDLSTNPKYMEGFGGRGS